ncbi:cupin domain-containing protein [Luteimonas sp. TWI414]|uniref:JmjC domain-containing protein n=1 Tax=Luteimonas sp. TWI414 TaxID=3136779 RepID=UPI00320A4716
MKAMPYLQAQGPIDWAQFVATCWDRRPVVFRRHGAAPYPLDAALAAAASAARTANGDEQACRFVLDDRQRRQPGAWLPRHEDATFERYAQRILREGGGRSYALIVNEFHRHDRRIWEGGRRFFQGLFAQVGLPSTGAITTLFHGNYERTPVGVHKDRFATFVFVLQGRKRMRFWPTRPWQDAVATRVDYAEHLADSFAIDVGPGDLLYWPAAYYHVGETLGVEVATSVNVGIPRDGHALLYDFDAIVRAADALDAQAAAAGDACGDDAGAADQVAGALATVRRLATPAAGRRAPPAGAPPPRLGRLSGVAHGRRLRAATPGVACGAIACAGAMAARRPVVSTRLDARRRQCAVRRSRPCAPRRGLRRQGCGAAAPFRFGGGRRRRRTARALRRHRARGIGDRRDAAANAGAGIARMAGVHARAGPCIGIGVDARWRRRCACGIMPARSFVIRPPAHDRAMRSGMCQGVLACNSAPLAS